MKNEIFFIQENLGVKEGWREKEGEGEAKLRRKE